MHHHDVLLIVVVAVVVAIAIGALALVAGLAVRRRLFRGSAQDQWQAVRSDLSGREQFRVQWATMRRRKVDDARLLPAQRAWISCARTTA